MRSAFSPTLLVTLSVVSLLFVFVTSQTPEGADLTGADIAQIENGIAQDEKKFKNAVEHFAEEVGKNLPDTDLGSISEEEYEQRKTAMLKSIESGDDHL